MLEVVSEAGQAIGTHGKQTNRLDVYRHELLAIHEFPV